MYIIYDIHCTFMDIYNDMHFRKHVYFPFFREKFCMKLHSRIFLFPSKHESRIM